MRGGKANSLTLLEQSMRENPSQDVSFFFAKVAVKDAIEAETL
jgi:hypothetical protein